MNNLLGPLKSRNFACLIAGTTVSLIGDGVYTVAIAIAALQASNKPSTLGAVAMANLIPRMACTLWGGVLADRVSRRLLLTFSDLLRGTAVTALALVYWQQTPALWLVLALLIPLGAGSGLATPAFSAILPDTVPSESLVAANSLMSTIRPLCLQMLGPALGGILASIDISAALLVDSATFFVSAGFILALSTTARPERTGPPAMPWRDLIEGISYVRRTRWLLANLACGSLAIFSTTGALVLLPFLVTNAYGGTGRALGTLLAVGGTAGVLAAVAVGSRRPPGDPLVTSYLVFAIGLPSVAGLGLAGNSVIGAIFVAVLFASLAVGEILQNGAIGGWVPRQLQGRVNSLDWVGSTALAPLSIIVTAGLADRIGVRATFVAAGVVATGAALFGFILLHGPIRTPARPVPATPLGENMASPLARVGSSREQGAQQ